MRVPYILLFHMDRFDWCHLKLPLRDVTEFKGYFKGHDEGKFEASDLAARFCFIDPLLGVLTLKNNSLTSMMMASHIDLDTDDPRKIKETMLDPFLGHSIVWNAENFPDEAYELLGHMGAFEDRWGVAGFLSSDSVREKKPRKRGPKPTGAKQEYFRRYPDAKPNGVSFEAIAAELLEAGFPISARQIQNYEKMRTIG